MCWRLEVKAPPPHRSVGYKHVQGKVHRAGEPGFLQCGRRLNENYCPTEEGGAQLGELCKICYTNWHKGEDEEESEVAVFDA
eukprot:10540372-Karenia_brevis.AAC.1